MLYFPKNLSTSFNFCNIKFYNIKEYQLFNLLSFYTHFTFYIILMLFLSSLFLDYFARFLSTLIFSKNQLMCSFFPLPLCFAFYFINFWLYFCCVFPFFLPLLSLFFFLCFFFLPFFSFSFFLLLFLLWYSVDNTLKKFIEVQLIYSVVLISAVQHSDSVIHIYIIFHIPFHYCLSQDKPSLATTSLFSMSVSLFLFHRYVHLCHISDST